jgi:hypothetical protein
MSTRHLPYPPDFDVNYHADREIQRVEAARKRLTVSDVLSVLDDKVAGLADETSHPCYHLVAWLLDKEGPVDGAAFWTRWQQLAEMAVDSCLDDLLEMGD